MKIHLILLLLAISSYCTAQHFNYTYDPAGNRTNRNYTTPRLANPSLAIIEKKYGISVFPNPVPDKINISISSLEEGETAKVCLMDELGKILLMREQNSKLATIELTNLNSGVYYIKVYIKSEMLTYKIVKL